MLKNLPSVARSWKNSGRIIWLDSIDTAYLFNLRYSPPYLVRVVGKGAMDSKLVPARRL